MIIFQIMTELPIMGKSETRPKSILSKFPEKGGLIRKQQGVETHFKQFRDKMQRAEPRIGFQKMERILENGRTKTKFG